MVKTVQFGRFGYIGDPLNTCRIFNELEVDELCFLDIQASRERREPHYWLLSEIADECFMPLAYGGGISSVVMAERVFQLGFEKVVLNSHAIHNPSLIEELARIFGSQSIVVSIDVKKNFLGNAHCYNHSGMTPTQTSPVEWAKTVESLGAGEILLTSVDREGTWQGYDLTLLREVADAVTIPVIAHGGAGSLADIGEAVKKGHASAVAVGSMVVYQKKGMGVLVNFPDEQELKGVLA